MRPTQLFIFVFLFAVAVISTQALHPFQGEVLDHTHGTPDTRFSRENGKDYAMVTLISATVFVIFGQNETEGRGYTFVQLVVESFSANRRPFAISTTNGSRIDMNADYLLTFPGNLTDQFNGLLYFTSGLVWEWNGNGSTPIGLVTGIADYIRLVGGWAYKGWPQRGSGLRRDEGYVITANFSADCEWLRRGFASDLSDMMIDSYRDAYFVELLGKSE